MRIVGCGVGIVASIVVVINKCGSDDLAIEISEIKGSEASF